MPLVSCRSEDYCCVGLKNGVQIKTVAVWMELDGQKEKLERKELVERKGLIVLRCEELTRPGVGGRVRERGGHENLSERLFFVLRTKNFINFVRLVWLMSFAAGIWKCKQSFVRQFKTADILLKHGSSIRGVTLDH